MAKRFGLLHLLLRRITIWILGIFAFPFVCWFARLRARFYSCLFRAWFKRAREPVWLTRLYEGSDHYS